MDYAAWQRVMGLASPSEECVQAAMAKDGWVLESRRPGGLAFVFSRPEVEMIVWFDKSTRPDMFCPRVVVFVADVVEELFVDIKLCSTLFKDGAGNVCKRPMDGSTAFLEGLPPGSGRDQLALAFNAMYMSVMSKRMTQLQL